MKNKLINLLYRGGAGGEFFGGLLVSHQEVATKELKYDDENERWFLERDDWQSERTEVTRSEDPRKGVREPSKWNEELWNVRLDHGYGFPIHTDFWIDYLWNEWKETKTIIFKSKTQQSLEYTQSLATAKLGLGTESADAIAGQNMVIDGIMDVTQFWQRPWESDAYYFDMFMDMIPDDHDFLLIDPCDLLHSNRVISRDCLQEIVDYIGIDDYLLDEWVEKIENYRVNNKKLINKTMV